MRKSPTPDSWRDIYLRPKCIFSWPDGSDWAIVADRALLSGNAKLVLPLADAVSSLSIQGLSLILQFAVLQPNDGAAILQYEEGAGAFHLGRFDFGEADSHSNMKARAGGLRSLQTRVNGSHLHPFAANEPLGRDAFDAKKGSLPAAIKIDDNLVSFRQRMRVISSEFGIDALDGLPPPPYPGDLLQ